MILSPSPEAYRQAAECLARGDPVGLPTETVYGLAADATNDQAVARVYAIKGRPHFNPLIIHVADRAQALAYGTFSDEARRLADAFWPGPLTLIVPRLIVPENGRQGLSALALDGGTTVALRVPAQVVARELLRVFGKPLAAPSANRYGRVSPTAADHVASDLGHDVPLILDGGPARYGVESTIIACLEEGTCRLLRPGGITRKAVESLLGYRLDETKPPHPVSSPGQDKSHYAPLTPVRLEALTVNPDEALLAFGPDEIAGREKAVGVYNLSDRADPEEAAARLFTGLRRLDGLGAHAIAVMPIPDQGLGEAINDRLKRAAYAFEQQNMI